MHKRAQLLFGFLQGAKTYPDMVEVILDNAISDTALENIFPLAVRGTHWFRWREASNQGTGFRDSSDPGVSTDRLGAGA